MYRLERPQGTYNFKQWCHDRLKDNTDRHLGLIKLIKNESCQASRIQAMTADFFSEPPT